MNSPPHERACAESSETTTDDTVTDTPPHPRYAPTCPRCLTCLNPQNALPPGISQKSGEITFATALANAGMSLQALMALLGHVTPEMTIRYATLASPTLRSAYDQAMGTMRRQLTLTPVGRPIVPDKVTWLASEMLKTRVAHGYCSRHEGQGACPYANICETCDSYTPATEFAPALTDQLDDIHVLQADADRRGWTSEAQRHDRVAKALKGHLDRLQPR